MMVFSRAFILGLLKEHYIAFKMRSWELLASYDLQVSISPLTFACSKSTIETVEKVVKYGIIDVAISHLFLVFLLLTLSK